MLLTPEHYTLLHKGSAIADALIKARGYQSLSQPEDIIDRGFSKAQARTAPALGIPLWDVYGQRHSWQIRPDQPRQMRDGKVNKYEAALGDRNILDIHPHVQPLLADPGVTLWITEGVRHCPPRRLGLSWHQRAQGKSHPTRLGTGSPQRPIGVRRI